MKSKSIFAILFASIVVVFSLQDVEVTEVKFFMWKLSLSRVLIILGSIGIGVLVGILVSMKHKMVKTKN